MGAPQPPFLSFSPHFAILSWPHGQSRVASTNVAGPRPVQSTRVGQWGSALVAQGHMVRSCENACKPLNSARPRCFLTLKPSVLPKPLVLTCTPRLCPCRDSFIRAFDPGFEAAYLDSGRARVAKAYGNWGQPALGTATPASLLAASQTTRSG